MRKFSSNLKGRIRDFLDQFPYIKELRKQVSMQGLFVAGHFYSPVPDIEDVRAYLLSTEISNVMPLELYIDNDNQFKLLEDFSMFYGEMPFSREQTTDCRYHDFHQTEFHIGDAIYLYSFLRQNKPKKIIEVGSGYSSAVILDTCERFLSKQPDITFIDPYPQRLLRLLRQDDLEKTHLIESKVQKVPIENFSSLEPGDLLFIDSSHVVKSGSDLQFLLFEVLPKLKRGVFVHFHDIFFPMEYPSKWLLEGRYWNEIYFLRAFLAYNSEWEIYFYGSYVGTTFDDFIKLNMPLVSCSKGGSLYIRRRSRSE